MTAALDAIAARKLNEYPLAELKLIYRILHAQLMQHIELIDAQLLQDLQAYLQARAGAEGVILADHAQWDHWLGNEAIPCEERLQDRRTL